MSQTQTVKVTMKACALQELRKLNRSGDEISRLMSERAQKLMKDEPVEPVALRVNFY